MTSLAIVLPAYNEEENVASAVEEQSATTQEIATNVAQASEGIQEVNANVSQSSAVAIDGHGNHP